MPAMVSQYMPVALVNNNISSLSESLYLFHFGPFQCFKAPLILWLFYVHLLQLHVILQNAGPPWASVSGFIMLYHIIHSSHFTSSHFILWFATWVLNLVVGLRSSRFTFHNHTSTLMKLLWDYNLYCSRY